MSELQTARWIELDGADNVRDLGGLPDAGGASVQPGRLIRSDSLQDLTAADVRHLVDELGVRSVADLRTGVEVAGEGPGPMTREPLVRVEHYSLFPEPDEVQVSDSGDGPVVLPWQQRAADEPEDERRRGVSGVYLRYLDERADSVLAALRLIAEPDGATIVHCAAGKDRTGVVVALALAEVGVEPAAIVADYALSAERVEAILARLVARRTYATDLVKDEPVDKHKPKPATMERLLAAMDEQHGGVRSWLRANGWTEQDAAALRSQLLEA
ncbi:MAG TPA: tyrosine-protein phosphatase [Jatrophihabitans sp.]|nr:tyrosine-protein phosphatase [Jatrophihabitans sp.]